MLFSLRMENETQKERSNMIQQWIFVIQQWIFVIQPVFAIQLRFLVIQQWVF